MKTKIGKTVILSAFLFTSFLLLSGCTSAGEEMEKTIDRQKEKSIKRSISRNIKMKIPWKVMTKKLTVL